MIDLHAHVLPGVDDGASTLEEAVALAELSAESQVKVLAVTPHSNQPGNFENYYDFRLKERFLELEKTIKEKKLPLVLVRGMEIYCWEGVGKNIRDGRLIGINKTDHYLVEFPFDAPPDWIRDRLEEILYEGKYPLIAHPERYFCVQEYPAVVYEWMRMGCSMQMNKGSILGRFGRKVRHTAEILMEYDLISCVASDAHSPYQRTTYLEDVKDYLIDHWGEETAYLLLHKNPARVLYNKKIPAYGVMPQRKRGWL